MKGLVAGDARRGVRVVFALGRIPKAFNSVVFFPCHSQPAESRIFRTPKLQEASP